MLACNVSTSPQLLGPIPVPAAYSRAATLYTVRCRSCVSYKLYRACRTRDGVDLGPAFRFHRVLIGLAQVSSHIYLMNHEDMYPQSFPRYFFQMNSLEALTIVLLFCYFMFSLVGLFREFIFFLRTLGFVLFRFVLPYLVLHV